MTSIGRVVFRTGYLIGRIVHWLPTSFHRKLVVKKEDIQPIASKK